MQGQTESEDLESPLEHAAVERANAEARHEQGDQSRIKELEGAVEQMESDITRV